MFKIVASNNTFIISQNGHHAILKFDPTNIFWSISLCPSVLYSLSAEPLVFDRFVSLQRTQHYSHRSDSEPCSCCWSPTNLKKKQQIPWNYRDYLWLKQASYYYNSVSLFQFQQSVSDILRGNHNRIRRIVIIIVIVTGRIHQLQCVPVVAQLDVVQVPVRTVRQAQAIVQIEQAHVAERAERLRRAGDLRAAHRLELVVADGRAFLRSDRSGGWRFFGVKRQQKNWLRLADWAECFVLTEDQHNDGCDECVVFHGGLRLGGKTVWTLCRMAFVFMGGHNCAGNRSRMTFTPFVMFVTIRRNDGSEWHNHLTSLTNCCVLRVVLRIFQMGSIEHDK